MIHEAIKCIDLFENSWGNKLRATMFLLYIHRASIPSEVTSLVGPVRVATWELFEFCPLLSGF